MCKTRCSARLSQPPCMRMLLADQQVTSTALRPTSWVHHAKCICAAYARYLRNITNPSGFITKSDGQTLKDLFKKTPAVEVDDVYVVLDWNDVLPRAQRVRPFAKQSRSLHVVLHCVIL